MYAIRSYYEFLAKPERIGAIMKKRGKKLLKQLRIEPGTRVRLKDHDPGWAGTKEMRELGRKKLTNIAKRRPSNTYRQKERLK